MYMCYYKRSFLWLIDINYVVENKGLNPPGGFNDLSLGLNDFDHVLLINGEYIVNVKVFEWFPITCN